MITVMSFGHKFGEPPTANFVFDVRHLSNPHWSRELRAFDGRHPAVQNWLRKQADVRSYLDLVGRVVLSALQGDKAKSDNWRIAFGCTGGQHRSVYFAEQMYAEILMNPALTGFHTVVAHREIT